MAAHIGQAAAASRQQVLHRHIGREGIVGIDPGENGIEFRLADADLGEIPLQQLPLDLGGDVGAVEDDAVGAAAGHGILQNLLHLLFGTVQIQQGQVVPPAAELVLRAADDIEHVRIAEGQPLAEAVGVQNVPGRPLGKVRRRNVGGIAHRLHHRQHLFPGSGGNIHLIIEHLADGCRGNAGLFGHVLDGISHKNLPSFSENGF